MKKLETSAANHTAGEWKVERIGDEGLFYNAFAVIVDDENYRGGRVICRTPTHTSEEEANARLIASAPDLLAACEKAFDYSLPIEERKELVYRAISKAKGGIK